MAPDFLGPGASAPPTLGQGHVSYNQVVGNLIGDVVHHNSLRSYQPIMLDVLDIGPCYSAKLMLFVNPALPC